MKNKKILIAVGAVAAVLALAAAGLPIFCRVYYGRSLQTMLFAWQLHKDTYTTQEAFEEYLGEKRRENALAYTIPDDIELAVPVEAFDVASMNGFILNAEGSGPLVVYFPGGSYIDQPRPVHWQFLDSLAQDTDAVIAVAVYPRLPDNTVVDACAALDEFYTALSDRMPGGERIFMGDSAGGGLALSFAMRLRDSGRAVPDELILICPWVDVTMENPDIAAYEKKDPALDVQMLSHLGRLWAGQLDPKDPVVSPLYGDLRGAAGNIAVVTTPGELLYPDIMRLCEKLRDEGQPCELYEQQGQFHVWPLYRDYLDEAELACQQIAGIIRRPQPWV